jgi:hypothetical protein
MGFIYQYPGTISVGYFHNLIQQSNIAVH